MNVDPKPLSAGELDGVAGLLACHPSSIRRKEFYADEELMQRLLATARKGVHERGSEWVFGNDAVDEVARVIEHEDGLQLTNRQRQVMLSAVLHAISRGRGVEPTRSGLRSEGGTE